MNFITTLRTSLVGYKFYILMALGVLTAVAQFILGVNIGIPDMPPAQNIGELIQQVYLFLVGAAGRAALTK